MKTEIFNNQRFVLLLQRQILFLYKPWLVSLIAVAGSIMFIAFLVIIGAQNDGWIVVYKNLSMVAFVIMGAIFASRSFSEMGTLTKSLQYITLPATLFEKFFVSWLVSSVMYVAVFLSIFIIGSAFMSFTSILLNGGSFLLLDPFNSEFANVLFAFFVLHTCFFLGAVWFKKGAFFKTLLSMFIVNIILNAWTVSFFLIIIRPLKFFNVGNNLVFQHIVMAETSIKQYITVYIALLSLFLLFIAWVRFNEREV
jgi:hypothetical protein